MTNHAFELNEKVCIITGAGKGIGRETAKVFKEAGARLALITRTESDLVSLLDECHWSDDDVLCQAGDVSDPETVTGFVRDCKTKFGQIDVLINNAGMRFRKPFLDTSFEEWETVIRTNLGSTFLFCQAVGRHMVERQTGKIVNMASIIGPVALPELIAYGASKGGMISLTKGLALEWAEHNVNVNAIAPGFCETSYTENFKKKTELYQFTLDRTPMGKWGRPEDIANACLFLSSEASRYITGEVLTVDGGWCAW
jgi:gluconate 5-dehydrogenase